MVRNFARKTKAIGASVANIGRVMRRGFLVAGTGIVLAMREADRFRRSMALVNTMLTSNTPDQYAGGIKRLERVMDTFIGKFKPKSDNDLGSTFASAKKESDALNDSLINGRSVTIKELTNDVSRLASEFGLARQELADGLYATLSGQIPPNNAIAFLTQGAKAAIGGATETETAVKAIIKVIESYGLASSDAVLVSDKLFRMVEKGSITYDELVSKLGVVSGLAAKAGVSLDELGGIIATSSKTVNPESLFTGLRASLNALLKPGPLLAKEMKKLNTTGGEMIKQNGLVGALETLNTLANGSIDTFTQLVGTARALPLVISVTGEGAKKAAKNIEAMANSADASERV